MDLDELLRYVVDTHFQSYHSLCIVGPENGVPLIYDCTPAEVDVMVEILGVYEALEALIPGVRVAADDAGTYPMRGEIMLLYVQGKWYRYNYDDNDPLFKFSPIRATRLVI